MALSIPKEQKHGVDVPVMLPFYNYIKLTPMGSQSEFTLQPNTYMDEIRWEISGDNVMNLAKSYIQFDIDIPLQPTSANTQVSDGGYI